MSPENRLDSESERSATSQDVLYRNAARVLLIAPDGATLLVRGQDPEDLARGSFYWTPGGGLDEGESLEDGARREVFEELGHVVSDLGPVVLERVGEFPFAGRQVHQTEAFFIVEVVDTFECVPDQLSELERRSILGFDWLTPAEMRTSSATVFPVCLPDLVDEFCERGRPVPAWGSSDAISP